MTGMRPARRVSAPRHRADRGASFLQYALLFLVVALMFGVMIPILPNTAGGTITVGICRLIYSAFGVDEQTAEELCEPLDELPGDDIAEPEEPPLTDEDFEPSLCQVQAEMESRGLRAQFFLSYDGKTVVSKIEMADGSVWYIAEPWNEAYGASLGFSAVVPLGPTGFYAGGWAQVDGAYNLGNSRIWVFKPDESDKAEEFERELRDDTSIGSNPFSQAWNHFFGDNSGPDLDPSTMDVDMSGWSGDLVGGPQGGWGPVFSAPRVLRVDGGAVRTVRTDYGGSLYYPEGGGQDIISENHQISGSVTGDGMVLLGGAAGPGGGAGWSAGIRADRHEDGELQGIYINASYELEGHLRAANPFGVGVGKGVSLTADASYQTGLGRMQNTYVWIGFDNDEEREIGEQFLSEYSGYGGALDYFWETMGADHAFLDEDPGPGGDPWEKLLYDNALVWQSTGLRESSSSSLGPSGFLGIVPIGPYVPFGAGWNSSSYNQSTYDAWFLGAPNEDGTREYVPHDACIA